jgi:hypothetical protein
VENEVREEKKIIDKKKREPKRFFFKRYGGGGGAKAEICILRPPVRSGSCIKGHMPPPISIQSITRP